MAMNDPDVILIREDGEGSPSHVRRGSLRFASLSVGMTLFLLLPLPACSKKEQADQRMVQTGGGREKRGRQLIDQYGCTACHSIPGIDGPKGMVGPPLDHIGSRTYIAGKFPNRPEVLMRWLQNPQAMDPQNAMPNLGVTPSDARDIAAYLYSLK